jgi:hypothetical protein
MRTENRNRMKKLQNLFLGLCLTLTPAYARHAEPLPEERMAVLPVTVKISAATAANNDNRSQLIVKGIEHVMPDIVRQAEKKKWPFRMILPDKVQPILIDIGGASFSNQNGLRFNQLKLVSEKANARYIALFTLYDFDSYSSRVGLLDGSRAVATIEVMIYDHQTNEYVWQKTATGKQAKAHFLLFFSASHEAMRDDVLFEAIQQCIEPFARGERMKLARPGADVVASVKKVFNDGKRVLLDINHADGIFPDDALKSSSSEAQLRVVEVFANGCIAEVSQGHPAETETFTVSY